MIKEDFVSFEVAQLLKEKGFDEPCMAYYTTSTHKGHEVHYDVYSPCNSDLNIIFCNMEFGSLPTHQIAMKWLRRVHNVNIDIVSIWNQKRFEYQVFVVTPENAKQCYVDDKLYLGYEEAVEGALKYCLKNLI